MPLWTEKQKWDFFAALGSHVQQVHHPWCAPPTRSPTLILSPPRPPGQRGGSGKAHYTRTTRRAFIRCIIHRSLRTVLYFYGWRLCPPGPGAEETHFVLSSRLCSRFPHRSPCGHTFWRDADKICISSVYSIVFFSFCFFFPLLFLSPAPLAHILHYD